MPHPLGKPVAAPQPKKGQDARSYAAETLGALGEANSRIQRGAEFYEDVRTRGTK